MNTPLGWLLQPVEAKGDVTTGKALAARAPGKQRPYLRTKNVFDGRIVTNDVLTMPMTDAEFKRYRVLPGDVLLNEGQSLELVGRCAVYRDENAEPCAMQNQLLRFRARPGVSAEFAAHLFRYSQQEGKFARIALQTTSIAHLGATRLEKLQLLWPEREAEQGAIAEALCDMDLLIEGLETLIAKKRAVRHAAMQQLLTGRTRLPEFSGAWEVRRLGDYVRFLRHGTMPRTALKFEEEVTYLHYGDVHASKAVFLGPNLARLQSLPREAASNLDRLKNGDLVMVDASEDLDGVGKSIEIASHDGREVVAGLHTIAARFDEAVFANGFKGYLQFVPQFGSHLRRLAAGTKVYATNRSHIVSAEIRLPGPREQRAIADVLSDMGSELESLEQRLAKTRAIKRGAMQQLLTGRIRLPLDSEGRHDKGHADA